MPKYCLKKQNETIFFQNSIDAKTRTFQLLQIAFMHSCEDLRTLQQSSDWKHFILQRYTFPQKTPF